MPSIEEKFGKVRERIAEESPIERIGERVEQEQSLQRLRERIVVLENEKMELERGGGADENVRGYIAQLQEQNALLKRDVEEQTHRAEVDSRTGLLNKDALERRVRPLHAIFAGQRFAGDKRGGPQASFNLIVIDFDHFKDVNDTYGHLAGDAALKHMADILRKTVRENDWVARWGGDEFVVVFMAPENTGVTGENRGIVAEKLRRAIDSSPLEYEGTTIPLTGSLGVAKARTGESFEDFFARADYAASAAKRKGRNTVVIAELMEDELAKKRSQVMALFEGGDDITAAEAELVLDISQGEATRLMDELVREGVLMRVDQSERGPAYRKTKKEPAP